jgi:hypothetical protein
MSGQIPRLIGLTALVATLLMPGVGRHRADQRYKREGLSFCTELSRTAGEPLVLPIGLGNSAQVLVRACARPAGATSGSAGYNGAGHNLAFDASSVRTKTCG